jgi:hypothetical protein
MRDHELDLYGKQVTQLLEPGERLLAMADFFLAPGKIKVELPPDSPDDRSGLRKAAETTAVVTAAVLTDSLNGPSLNRMLGTVSATGDAQSWAARLLAARDLTTKRSSDLVVTDLRLLLVSKKIWGKDPDYRIDLAIPRDALGNVARRGRPLARGRVVIEFTDGSMVALRRGAFFTGRAGRLVQALASPGDPATPGR